MCSLSMIWRELTPQTRRRSRTQVVLSIGRRANWFVLIETHRPINQHHASDLQMGGSLLQSAAHDLLEAQQASSPED